MRREVESLLASHERAEILLKYLHSNSLQTVFFFFFIFFFGIRTQRGGFGRKLSGLTVSNRSSLRRNVLGFILARDERLAQSGAHASAEWPDNGLCQVSRFKNEARTARH